jgi:hypothetical protein
MPTTDLRTPKPFTLLDAALTSTPIAGVGPHPVTGEVMAMYFTDDADVRRYLTRGGTRPARPDVTVFDLNRETGQWASR